MTVDAGSDQTICLGQTVQIGGSPTADNSLNGSISYSWTPNTSISNTNISNPNVYPTTTTTYTVTVTRSIFGVTCDESDDVTITVNPLPNVTLSNFSDVCLNDPPFFLSGGSPTGGIDTYSGNGVGSNVINPLTAGVGNHQITYSHTDANGCENSATNSINILPLPDASIWDYTSPNPFTGCSGSGSPFDLYVDNTSSTTNTNTNYTIDWGDGSPFYDSSALAQYNTLHSYNTQGYFSLVLTLYIEYIFEYMFFIM